MKSGSQIAWDDTVLPFQLDACEMRGRIARLDGVLDGVLQQHNYPPVVEALVSEMALLTALIGESIKLRWKLSLQVQSKGAVRMIATDYYGPETEGAPARMRAYASFDEARLTEGPIFDQIGEGYFAILIDQGADMTPYQGITPLVGGSLSACAEAYFAQSEQLPTTFKLCYGTSRAPDQPAQWRAGGIMLQHIPKSSLEPTMDEGGSGDGGLLMANDIIDADDRDNWNRMNILLNTVEELEMIGPVIQPSQLLLRLFREDRPRVFDAQAVRFGCTCSQERVRQSLSIYSAKDIASMTREDGLVTADCQFCGAHYQLDPTSVGFQPGSDDSAPA